MLVPNLPHACEVCQSKLLLYLHSYNRCPEKGSWELITEHESSTGNEYGYWFNLFYGEAVELAEFGCAWMMWLVTLRRPDTTADSQLRAYFTHNSEEQLVLDWVEDINRYTDGNDFSRKLVLCAEAEYVLRGMQLLRETSALTMWLSNVAAAEIKHRLPNLNPSCAATMSKARTWLQTCTSTHQACTNRGFDDSKSLTSESEVMRPRRLIRIFRRSMGSVMSAHPSLCLVDTTHIQRPKYATLSYCWGGDQKVKLIKRNLVSWRSKVSFSHLPRTIKDAILVSAELGLEYIWIDALCIIQDDDADKSVELSRMGDIYSEAHVTLLASRSPRVQDGFLHSRYIPRERSYRLPYLCADGQIGSVVLWTGRPLGIAEPIHQRGWCFQEQVLSPRILEFGTHQMRYLCNASRTGDAPPEADGWVTNSETFAQYGIGHSLDLPANWYTLSANESEFLDLWKRIVMHYSHLSLSHSTDRLRAISAIARKFGQSSCARYYTGLWAEHLPSQLLWEVDHDDHSLQKATRAVKFVAPTWSWASIEGPVTYSWTDSDSIICQRLNVLVENGVSGDDFSDVLSAELRLRTLTLYARLARQERASPSWWVADTAACSESNQSSSPGSHEDSGDEHSSRYHTFLDPESEKQWTDLCGQYDESITGSRTVLLAQITVDRGLILAMQPHNMKSYTRVGIFRLDTFMEDDDRWEQRDVTIV